MYSDLANIIIEALIYAEQATDREVNPWLEQWRGEFEYAAEQLRSLSTNDIAIEDNIATDLKDTATSLDKVASLRLSLGCGEELEKLTEQATQKLIALKQKNIDPVKLSNESLSHVSDTVIITGRKLTNLTERAHNLVESGRIEELQSEASSFGHDLLRLSQYNIDELGADLKNELSKIGRKLHLVETMRIQMDGGRSLNEIINRISESKDSISKLIDTYNLN